MSSASWLPGDTCGTTFWLLLPLELPVRTKARPGLLPLPLPALPALPLGASSSLSTSWPSALRLMRCTLSGATLPVRSAPPRMRRVASTIAPTMTEAAMTPTAMVVTLTPPPSVPLVPTNASGAAACPAAVGPVTMPPSLSPLVPVWPAPVLLLPLALLLPAEPVAPLPLLLPVVPLLVVPLPVLLSAGRMLTSLVLLLPLLPAPVPLEAPPAPVPLLLPLC
mmetsp:Transcript_102999/g.286905  ORF Transcript_102999/g.286905 Transcript_102999/m.286905 type:complete len:222 (+) Transcript_102999:845-1510(+)